MAAEERPGVEASQQTKTGEQRTVIASLLPVEISAAPARGPLQWKRGLQALRALMDDPDTTAHAMDLQHALGVRDIERNFQQLARDPVGRKLLVDRPNLLEALDREALSSLPEGSFGRAMLEYLDRFGFDPRSLVSLGHAVRERWLREEGEPELDAYRAWYQDRTLLLHDVFHVLSGYDADHVGEATLLAFSLGQLRGRVNLLLTIGASVEVMQQTGWRWLPYVYRAYRRGRRAAWLHSVHWEALLALPLDEVRALARVDAPEHAHPKGVLRGDLAEAAALLAP